MPIPLLDAGLPAPAAGVFTTREGGCSDGPYAALNLALHVGDHPDRVQANRERLAAQLGVSALAFAEQVHGAQVAIVDCAGTSAGVDALVTTRPGLGLVMMAADCLPVLLADPDAGVVAAAHAGRKGLVAGVLQETVQRMVAQGASMASLRAVIGPAADGCCYEVPAAMAHDVEDAVPGTRTTTRQGTPSVNLRVGAQRLLTALGVQVEHVSSCTIDDERFFSYRRERVTGRHAGVVWIS